MCTFHRAAWCPVRYTRQGSIRAFIHWQKMPNGKNLQRSCAICRRCVRKSAHWRKQCNRCLKIKIKDKNEQYGNEKTGHQPDQGIPAASLSFADRKSVV